MGPCSVTSRCIGACRCLERAASKLGNPSKSYERSCEAQIGRGVVGEMEVISQLST